MEEVHAQHHTQSFHVGRGLILIYHMLIADDENIARVDNHLLGVESILDSTFSTQSDEDKVHLSGLCRHRSLVDVLRQQEVVVKENRLAPALCLVQICFFDL